MTKMVSGRKRFCTVRQNGMAAAQKAEIAAGFFEKLAGLMLRPVFGPGDGLLLKNCGSIHCCFMRFPIDAVYLDKELTVLYKETLRPWTAGHFVKGAKHVLELPKGRAREIQIGEKMRIEAL